MQKQDGSKVVTSSTISVPIVAIPSELIKKKSKVVPWLGLSPQSVMRQSQPRPGCDPTIYRRKAATAPTPARPAPTLATRALAAPVYTAGDTGEDEVGVYDQTSELTAAAGVVAAAGVAVEVQSAQVEEPEAVSVSLQQWLAFDSGMSL
jgi:hypothetical protein